MLLIYFCECISPDIGTPGTQEDMSVKCSRVGTSADRSRIFVYMYIPYIVCMGEGAFIHIENLPIQHTKSCSLCWEIKTMCCCAYLPTFASRIFFCAERNTQKTRGSLKKNIYSFERKNVLQ